MDPDLVRLVATDLDGTLLGADSYVTDTTAATLAAVAESGVEVVACTGRGQYSARPRLTKVTAMRYAVFSNGAVVWDLRADEPIRWTSFAEPDWRDVIGWIDREYPEMAMAWESVAGYSSNDRWRELHPAASSQLSPTHPAEAVDPVKVLVTHHEIDPPTLCAHLAAAGLRAEVATSGFSFVEITALGVDKAHGLSWLCEHLDVTAGNVVAFGDQMNDLPMFAWVGHAVAMANAAEPVRAAADDHAGHHDDEGVGAYLTGFLGLHR